MQFGCPKSVRPRLIDEPGLKVGMDCLTSCAACVVCARPAEKLKCIKCKTPYCSAACQLMDWKERGHKATCKR